MPVNLQDIEQAARTGESEAIEFKRSIAEANTAARTFCASCSYRIQHRLPY
jgi:predicted Zn-dependent protease